MARQNIGAHDRCAVKIVCRNIEKALNLAGMQVHGQHAVGTRFGDQIGHQLGGNRSTGSRLSVLSGIAEIGKNSGDSLGRCASQRINHDQQFHQIVVRRVARGLNDEHVFAAHIFVYFYENLIVGKAPHACVRKGQAHIFRNAFGQGQVAVTRHQFHVCVPRKSTLQVFRPL